MKKNIQQNKRNKRMQKLLLSAISSKNYQPMRARDLAWLLEIPKAAQKDMMKALDELTKDHKIAKDERGNYVKALSGRAAAGEREKREVRENDRDRDREKEKKDKRERREKAQREASLRKDDPGADLTEVLLEYDIPLHFPEKVMRQADALPENPSEADMVGRLDLRDKTIITIDGDDSRDFDDAVSLERNGSGYILGVHIADVTNYVAAGSALDKEALRRGTSVYIPDRVIPMLPEKLSNGICSLNEGVDRLTLSCMVWLDEDAKITKTRICESVICSAHRMTYSKVDRIFEHDPELTAEYADIVPMLFDMKELAEQMQRRRAERGMIDFDFPEMKFELDEKRHPVRIYPAWATPATRLIEQFMLTANEVVAKTFADRNLPFVYRTHDHPDSDKMENVLQTLHEMGVPVRKEGQDITPKEVRRIIEQTEDSPKSSMISSMLLRAMQQARYSTENSGHFGLAAKYYCHFTSPIRRYPDLQIHRIIKDDLHGRLEGRKIGYYRRILDDVAWKSSALERRATEVERESDKVKMAEYVQDHLNEVTDAVITGVTGWGIYVQRPDMVEGLVHISTIHGDYYELDERTMRLVGRRTGRTFEIGQTVRVRTVSADVSRRIIDFALAEEGDSNAETTEDKPADRE